MFWGVEGQQMHEFDGSKLGNSHGFRNSRSYARRYRMQVLGYRFRVSGLGFGAPSLLSSLGPRLERI